MLAMIVFHRRRDVAQACQMEHAVYLRDKCVFLSDYQGRSFFYNPTHAAIERAERRLRTGETIPLEADGAKLEAAMRAGAAYWHGWEGDSFPNPSEEFCRAARELFESLNIQFS